MPIDLEAIRKRITLCLDLSPKASTIQVVLDAIQLADELEEARKGLRRGFLREQAHEMAFAAGRDEIAKLREALECLKTDGRYLFVRERTGDPEMPYMWVALGTLLCGETISLLGRALRDVSESESTKNQEENDG
jgi:hypothetical protein